MLRKQVSSTMAKSIGYDERARILEIEFQSGEVWQYDELPQSVYLAMLVSPSVGKFFQAHIRDKFNARRIS